MAKLSKRALGKGLDALIPITNREYEEDNIDREGPQEGKKIVQLKINNVDPNPDQPRREFDMEKLEELALSIEKHGVIQPIIVREHGQRHMIIAGERRWRAGKIAGLETIPAIIVDIDERQMYMFALVENLQREDLDPIEEAEGIKKLMDEYSLTQEEIAEEVGKSRSAIANTIRLLNLPEQVRVLIKNGKLTSGHGRAILGLRDRGGISHLIEEILTKDLNVRETERFVRVLNNAMEPKKKTTVEKPSYILDIELNLEESLGTKVNITPGKKRGIIQIEYYNNDDLQRIMDTIYRHR